MQNVLCAKNGVKIILPLRMDRCWNSSLIIAITDAEIPQSPGIEIFMRLRIALGNWVNLIQNIIGIHSVRNSDIFRLLTVVVDVGLGNVVNVSSNIDLALRLYIFFKKTFKNCSKF